ncbi:Protein of unknown function DUF2116, Zn-ribbon [uncultured Caudovirales phage]|uniref:DUF2116 family Zn-ribbon domain-containing protein n=1 Tax=uncultured Caudovirales phage TaxID=2100421 RepID=A0A6J5KZE3_9CAUD|nr:Protein of unknown function DUF2116, Zn-ribbon [uncultured Caudovirales phage]
MTDEFDRASDLEQQYRDIAIKSVRSKDTNFKFIGLCLNCGSKINQDKRFCDIDCRNDYEKRENAN